MTNRLNNVALHFISGNFQLKDRTRLKQFVLDRLREYEREVDAINFIFCDDHYLLDLNQRYLNHDTLTDIITFEMSKKLRPLVADIYISVERVKENANEMNIPFQKELHRVIFHGVLHLAGYKDKKAKQAQQMRQKEEEWLSLYFVSRNTVSGRNSG